PEAGLAHGTCIATDRGEVSVGDLVAGDRILTMDHGYQALLWSGPVAARPHDTMARVGIAADRLGPGMPQRRLELGPGHRLLLSGPLVALHTGEYEAFAAADHVATADAQGGGPLWHILLRDHELILANGLWCESVLADDVWLDTAPRGLRDELLDRIGTPHRQAARLCLARHETAAILGHLPRRDTIAA
ncbi:MAG: Hint domain-containing protein, partial [Albidovulum sp.]|uniref:Hint domain-containing protein n=1 Tax=Albidovulum sp. TaxID=1872424 RepID=UPI003CC002BD